MPKIILGLVLGVVTTVLFWLFVQYLEIRDVGNQGSAPTRPANTRAGAGSEVDIWYEPTVSGEHGSTGNENLVQEAKELAGVQDAAGSARQDETERRRVEVAKWRTIQPIISPVTLPPEFAWLAEADYRTPYDLIQREPVDLDWAPMTEAQLQSYFSTRQELINEYGWPVIHCGTTRCLVAFVVYGTKSDLVSTVSMQNRFKARVEDYLISAAESGLDNSNCECVTVHSEDGVGTLLWTLLRQREAAP